MKGILVPGRGRPSKVTKPTTPSRPRPGRRVGGINDSFPQTSDLEPQDDDNPDASGDEDSHHHPTFDTEAAIAAAAAAQHHHEQQQHQQHLDLTAANILANSVQNPDEQHDGLGGSHMEDDVPRVETTAEIAERSGYHNIVIESALAKRLATEPGARPAQQRRPEQTLNLARRSNVEALFAHISGEEPPQPCKNCHKGHGPWTSCVVVNGQLCGSCANCWFNASGARCSFHARNPPANSQMLGGDGMGFQMPSVAASAMAPFTFASLPASSDPQVRHNVQQTIAQFRGSDKKTRHMLLIEASARIMASHIIQYEEAVEEEQMQSGQQGAAQAVMTEQDGS
ncbi:uncharacterized protein GGS25DRAFT_118218 [Hypoxylon fragiforme]|uniref:uncharacterized protein n=1 Tax=Hypoxylon fragiforme TaxID=63214 RepID=UPI0020C5E88C|nr:uncharacterized protein GGS25DRAFT_118218 [Hypoxylon fragiforme]KAI2612406.1 hypothetical protein GGS25DRAFT_118218 [Hypoxylon fragiforme]